MDSRQGLKFTWMTKQTANHLKTLELTKNEQPCLTSWRQNQDRIRTESVIRICRQKRLQLGLQVSVSVYFVFQFMDQQSVWETNWWKERRRWRDLTTKIDTRGMSIEQILKVWSVNIRSRRMTQSSGSLEKCTACLVLCLYCLQSSLLSSVSSLPPVSSDVCIRMFPLRFTWSQRRERTVSLLCILPSTSVFLSC